MSDIKEDIIPPSMFLVLHQITSLMINSESGSMVELKFQKLGLQGVCPIYATRKGAEKYVIEELKKKLEEVHILELKNG